MENSIAHELYGDILQPTKVEFSRLSTTDDWDGDDLWHEDGSVEELDKASDLDREWQRRHDQFHTIGYRDGLIAGKEASAQEGFNIGFSESVFVGFNWGFVRGVTSALACLPNGLREGMVETQEKRNKFSHLYESVHSISTTDAQKLYYDDLSNKLVKRSDNAESSSDKIDLHDQSSDLNLLDNYYGQLQSLILESPAIKVHLKIDE